MAKITPKENFMKLRHGGMPEYVPFYSLAGIPYLGENAIGNIPINFFANAQARAGQKNMWGVPYTKPAEGGIDAAMPDTSIVTLEDISDWTKVVKLPEQLDVDIERVYNDFVSTRFDRSQSALKLAMPFQPFQTLVGLMGFEGGLCALYTDPEEVKAMLNAMVDFLEPHFEKMLDYLKPDIWSMADDTAAKETPFFSPEIYKDVFLPIYHRLSDCATRRDIPVEFHNCGKIGEFIPFMLDFGVEMTDPAQVTNDLVALKEEYKGKLSFCGGWEWARNVPPEYPKFDEEVLRQSVRDAMDKYAPGGGYAFYHSGLVSYFGDPVVEEVKRIVRDEAHWYGRKIYGYTGE